MKFSKMLKQGAKVLVKGAAALNDTGILEGVPIVGNILAGASLINDALEGREEADDALNEVKATVKLVSPIVEKLAGATEQLQDESLKKNLDAMSTVLEKIWDDVDAYVKRGEFGKYATSTSNATIFSDDLKLLRDSLNTLSISITGESFVAVLRTEGKVDNIALGVYATQQVVMGMAATQQGIAFTQQNMAAQISGIGAKKTVQERRDSENNKLAVEFTDLTFHEDSPFASGSFGGERASGKRYRRILDILTLFSRLLTQTCIG
jgi:hypothetical protein